jgi:hypothetical protein
MLSHWSPSSVPSPSRNYSLLLTRHAAPTTHWVRHPPAYMLYSSALPLSPDPTFLSLPLQNAGAHHLPCAILPLRCAIVVRVAARSNVVESNRHPRSRRPMLQGVSALLSLTPSSLAFFLAQPRQFLGRTLHLSIPLPSAPKPHAQLGLAARWRPSSLPLREPPALAAVGALPGEAPSCPWRLALPMAACRACPLSVDREEEINAHD